MGRIKGSKMTEEQKSVMRSRRRATKEGKAKTMSTGAAGLKHLSYDELETVST